MDNLRELRVHAAELSKSIELRLCKDEVEVIPGILEKLFGIDIPAFVTVQPCEFDRMIGKIYMLKEIFNDPSHEQASSLIITA